jgi:hypothetical protein
MAAPRSRPQPLWRWAEPGHRASAAPSDPFDRIEVRPYHGRSRGGAAAARRAHNPKVKGSNPFPATNAFILNPGSRPTRGSSFLGRFVQFSAPDAARPDARSRSTERYGSDPSADPPGTASRRFPIRVVDSSKEQRIVGRQLASEFREKAQSRICGSAGDPLPGRITGGTLWGAALDHGIRRRGPRSGAQRAGSDIDDDLLERVPRRVDRLADDHRVVG